jgi:hypothetical protein
MKKGDLVHVAPKNPLAKGSGLGKLEFVGSAIVIVQFLKDGLRLACLRSDCTEVKLSKVTK